MFEGKRKERARTCVISSQNRWWNHPHYWRICVGFQPLECAPHSTMVRRQFIVKVAEFFVSSNNLTYYVEESSMVVVVNIEEV